MNNASRTHKSGITAMVSCLALFAAIASTSAFGQGCPATDPNADYNCPIGPLYVLPGWGNVPWSLPQNYSTIRVGDLDGDGVDELIGRDALGLHVWSFNAANASWVPVLIPTGSTELVLSTLADANGWAPLQYSSTIQLVDVDGQPGAEVVARGGNGLAVFKFVQGAPTGFGFPTGSWTSVALSGPFADSDCFSNSKCWNAAPYYTTLRFGDLDGEPGEEAVGWGGGGLVAFKWTGSGWNPLPSLEWFGDAADYSYQSTALRVGRIDNSPKAKLYTLAADPDGLFAYEFTSGAWQNVGIPVGYFSDFSCGDWTTTQSCAVTLQAAVIDSTGVPVIMSRMTNCATNDGGWAGVQFDTKSGQWVQIFNSGPFDDCSGFSGPANFESIQAADLTGDGISEMVGRGPGGIVAFQYGAGQWSQIVNNTPALSDAVWASDPSYYASIRTGKVIPGGAAALLARGQNGVRTWTYANGAFSRPQPYGSFPPFESGYPSAAYGDINNFLNLPNGVRDLYINPTIDNSSTELRSYIAQIVNIHNGCQNEISADPPQYAECDPLGGTPQATYTQVVNQLIKELWLAANVVDHFTTVQTMQTALFTVQGTEFPSIADNLLLPQASNATAPVNYLNLFGGILQIIGGIFDQPELSVAGTAMSVMASALPFFQAPKNTTLDHAFAQIAVQIASFQQQMQATNLTQKHLVLGDYALLTTVGQLVGSQVWTIDEAGYLSANRQAFTQWVYQAFTPQIWSLWNVTQCADGNEDSGWIVWTCSVPTNGPYLQSSGNASFYGVFVTDGSGCNTYNSGTSSDTGCTWALPDTTSIAMVATPVSPQCTYAPGSGNAWVYGNAGSGGCTLGDAANLFANAGGWNFQTTQLNVYDFATGTSLDSIAQNVGGPSGQGTLILNFEAVLKPGVPDLRNLRFTVKQLLAESFGYSELVRDRTGAPFPFVKLRQRFLRETADHVRFTSEPGHSPRLLMDVTLDRSTWRLGVKLTADDMTLLAPQLCLGSPPTARLRFQLDLVPIGHSSQPYVVAQTADWVCVTDADGNVTALRPLGSAAVETTFVP